MVELAPSIIAVTHLLRKGNFLDPGDVVGPDLPRSLPPWPEVRPGTASAWRAGWSTRNPLTARVAVNRYWAQIFGAGLVETEEDFGTQGEPPSHPELLDWLAVHYRDSGWNTKSLLRLIVTSATYRQSSKVRPELLAKDPRNRLLARAPRVRLEAEMVRDQALALSGLLSQKVGGPSVFPPQPGACGKRPSTVSAPGRRARAKTGTAAVSTRSGGERCLIRRWPCSTPPAARSRDPPRADQYAAAVAGDLERPGLCRGRPGPRAADRPRRWG